MFWLALMVIYESVIHAYLQMYFSVIIYEFISEDQANISSNQNDMVFVVFAIRQNKGCFIL